MTDERQLKRYIVFAFNGYYPGGGKDDVIGDFDTLDEVKEAPMNSSCDYVEALDMDERCWITTEKPND